MSGSLPLRIGILADIHEAIDPLQRALAEFRRRGVDQVVSLGDACDAFHSDGRASEVVRLLRDASAIGVWGNHDIGWSFEVPETLRQQAEPADLEFMARMQPQLVVEGCRFSHVEPWLNSRKVDDLWYFDGPPDTPEKAARSFLAVPERHLFVGHFHCWLVLTPSERVHWNAEGPLKLSVAARYLVAIAPVQCGWCAIFDTSDLQLTPVACAA